MKFDPRMPLKNVNLVEALTLINADDMVNMERMEVLGDVFLKFRSFILKLFCSEIVILLNSYILNNLLGKLCIKCAIRYKVYCRTIMFVY